MDIQQASTQKLIASAITNVADSLGNPLSNPGITEDSELTLSGIGAASSVVFIFDNGVLLATASVIAPEGTWILTETVELGLHAFTVRDALAGADSPPWVITVVEAELDFQPPTVTQAPGDILNPIHAINGATVVVTYAMQTTDTIGLSWNGLDNLVPPQQGSTLGSVTFTIPPSAVAAVIGKTIPVLYAVVRNGDAKPSAQLDLTVQTLSDSVLEAPRILQATDGVNLDVGALTGDADLRVKPWPFIDAGQLISLRFEGTKADGSAYNWAHPSWQDLPISSTGEPSTTVAFDELKVLKDGSSLKLIFDVSFDGGITKILFPLRVLNVIQRASGFEDFETAVPGQVSSSGQLLASGVTISHMSSNPQYLPTAIVRAGAQHGTHGFQFWSLRSSGYDFTTASFTLPSGFFRSVEFTLWAANYASGLRVTCAFRNEYGTNLGGQTYSLPREGDLKAEFTAPPGQQIRVVTLMTGQSVVGAIACDSISWSE